ncbi:MAG: methyl-accepting chemotaxis protein [Chloroflexi bacterium]|nr:methyl-accepting chemotaxis protein [Chloroflexota bacterium]
MNKILNKLPIGLKLGGSFVIVILILTVSVIISYIDLGHLNNNVVSLYYDNTIPIQNLGETKALLGQIKSNIQLYIQIPQPKDNTSNSQNTPRCGSCHIAEVSGTHNLMAGQVAGDTNRCLVCHSAKANDPEHGRSAAAMAAGHTAELDCNGCHSAEVINRQHAQVEKSINDEVALVNKIIADYSQNPQLTLEEKKAVTAFEVSWNNYKNIVADLLFNYKNGKRQETLHRVVAGDALVSQKEIEETLNNLVTVNQTLANQSQEESVLTYNSSSRMLIITVLFGILMAIGLGTAITANILTPVEAMAKGLENMRQGDLNWDVSQQVRENMVQRSDELGTAGRGFDGTVQYLLEMAETAKQIASGDLTGNVNLRGGRDELGFAFSHMITSLETLIKKVIESANDLNLAAGQLASASGQSGEATNQIATTIQQVAKGTAEQTAGVTRTASSVEQMSRAIDGVARGAQEQAAAVTKASQVASRISTAIEQVTSNAQAVTRDSAEAARYSRDGAKTVKARRRAGQGLCSCSR